MQDWFAPANAFWLRKRDLDMNVTGPVFDYKGHEYTAQSSKECRIWLLDTSALGGEDHRTPVYQTPLVCNEEVHFSRRGPVGRAGDLGGHRRHAVGADAVLGAEASAVHGADRARRGGVRGRGGLQGADSKLRGAADARLAFAQHDQRRPGRDRQRRRIRATAAARTRRRPPSISAWRTTPRPIASPTRRTPRCTRSTRAPARSSGRAATRSRRSTTSPACLSRTDASTSARSTATSIASASMPRPARSEREHSSDDASAVRTC